MRFLCKLAVVAVTVGWGLEGGAITGCAVPLTGASQSKPLSSDNNLSRALLQYLKKASTSALPSQATWKDSKNTTERIVSESSNGSRNDSRKIVVKHETYETTAAIGDREWVRLNLDIQFPQMINVAPRIFRVQDSFAVLEISPINNIAARQSPSSIPMYYRGYDIKGRTRREKYSTFIKDNYETVYEIVANELYENATSDPRGEADWNPLSKTEITVIQQQRVH